jgi:hypothetical protein
VSKRRWVGGALWPDKWKPTAGADAVVQLTGKEMWAFDTQKFTLGLSCCGRISGGPGKKKLSWAIRNQNSQPTCVAQAVVACIELMRADGPSPTVIERLSVRFLYQQMRALGRDSGYKHKHKEEWNLGFTSLANAKRALQATGICSEEVWNDSGYLLAPPSEEAKRRAKKVKFEKIEHRLCATPTERKNIRPAEVILKELEEKRPVAIALPAFAASSTDNLSTNWNRESVLLTGNVPDPFEGEEPVENSGHAICVIGFLVDVTEGLGGGYFVFRNSLGEDFASLPPPNVLARGYGKISATHVANHCWELLTLKLP